MMLRKLNSVPTLFEAIASDVYVAMEQTGAAVTDDLRERLSIPVQYTVGPFGGERVIRSQPGESPRKETGDLQSSIRHDVEADADLYTLEITSDCPYAPLLEQGTDRVAKRPAWEPAVEAATDAYLDRLVRAVEGK